jgi:hypothetical protein
MIEPSATNSNEPPEKPEECSHKISFLEEHDKIHNADGTLTYRYHWCCINCGAVFLAEN